MMVRLFILTTLFASQAYAKDSQLQLLSDSVVIQKNAIQTLESVQSHSSDPEKSASLFQKIIESSEKLSSMQFELANVLANAQEPPAPIDLTQYQATLKKIVADVGTYVSRYPKSAGVQNVLLTRAKTYQLMDRNDLAEIDYATLAFSSPKNLVTSTAAVSLVYLRFDLGKYEAAALTAEKLATPESDAYYLPIQVKRAAALGKIGKNQEGLGILTPLLAKKTQMDALTIREVLNAMIELQIGAIHDKIPGASLAELARMLKEFAPAGVQYSPLELMAAQLITTEQSELLPAVESFADLVPEKDRTDAVSRYLILRLEHQLDQKLLSDARTTMNRIQKFVLPAVTEKKQWAKLYEVLTRSLESLRTSRIKGEAKDSKIAKVENAPSPEAIDQCLLSGYQLAIAIPEHPIADDYSLHFNLAETAFRMKQFTLATAQYQIANASKKDQKTASVDLKLISARYQDLLSKGIFPTAITPIAVPGKNVKRRPLDAPFQEWLGWVDQKSAVYDTLSDEEKKTIAEFDFAGARALYTHYDTVQSLPRLMKVIQTYPTQAVALNAALLLFDTEVESKAWEQMVRGTTTFLTRLDTVPGVNAELIHKLTIYRNDADFQLMKDAFVKKDYANVLTRGNHHLTAYPITSHHDEVLTMMGVASVSTGDRTGAQKYFSKTDMTHATAETKTIALANDVDTRLHNFDLVGASEAYLTLLRAGNFQDQDEKTKLEKAALDTAWNSQNNAQLQKSIAQVCFSVPSPESCVDYKNWLNLVSGKTDNRLTPALPLGKAIHVVFEFKTNFSALGKMPALWADLNGAEKSALVPFVDFFAHDLLGKRRSTIRNNSPIKLNPAAINKRVALLAQLEQDVETAQSFSWVSTQYFALKTVALAYQDFNQDILAIAAPSGITPAEKATFQQMLATNAAPFQKKASAFDARASALHPLTASALDANAIMQQATYTKNNSAFQTALLSAIAQKHAITASYLLQQSQNNIWLSPQGEKITMATILALTGGYTESAAIFKEAQANNALSAFRSLIPARLPASTGGKP